jgi:hypothetical protein
MCQFGSAKWFGLSSFVQTLIDCSFVQTQLMSTKFAGSHTEDCGGMLLAENKVTKEHITAYTTIERKKFRTFAL